MSFLRRLFVPGDPTDVAYAADRTWPCGQPMEVVDLSSPATEPTLPAPPPPESPLAWMEKDGAFDRWPGRVPPNSVEPILAVRQDGRLQWTEGLHELLGRPSHVLVLTRAGFDGSLAYIGIQDDPTETGLAVRVDEQAGFEGTYFAHARAALVGAGLDLDRIATVYARWALVHRGRAVIPLPVRL